MRILAIRGARLASLDAPFEVDLSIEPLRSAGVFAIVGPTGAGKSSLLDALCLALFDTTPRLERTPRQRLEDELAGGGDDLSGRDARTLVRRGAKEAFAEVDFVGVDGRTYRARWSVERGRTGRLRPAQLSLRDVASGRCAADTKGGTKGEVLAAIEAKLGLGLAELRRAVLLPQGEVAAFLDAPSDERAQLLERLTGAEIFAEVSKVVHVRAADARRARENIEITLGMLTVLAPGDAQRMSEELLAQRLDAARAEEKTAALVALRERHATVARLHAEERAARATLDELERQRALVELTRGDVALAERAEALAERLADARRAAEAVVDAGTRLEAERAAHLEARAAVEPLARAAAACVERRDQLEAEHARARAREEEALAAARLRVSSLPASSPDSLEQLRARERSLTRLGRMMERARDAETASARSEGEAESARERGRLARARGDRLDARALEMALDGASQAARLDEARRAHERVLLARSLETHRSCLVEGEPCPLCGAREHPAATRALAPLVDEAEARIATIGLALERTRSTLARTRASIESVRREVASAETAERAAGGAAARAREEAAALRREASALAGELGLPEDIEPALGPALARIDARVRELDALARDERAARDALSELEAAARAAHRASEIERAGAGARIEAALSAHARASEREGALASSVERHEGFVAVATEASARAREAADVALAAVGIARADAERVLGPDRERLRQVRIELARLDRERAAARARLDEREAHRAETEAGLEGEPVATGEALDTAITQARAARDEARRREAALDAALASDRATQARALELRETLAVAEAEEARWSGLDALVGAADGKRFRAHAQSITLERLVGFANAELAQLAPRFVLARAPLAGELALSVIDRESGHARRSVQSLSGGETFLVSLALALGLVGSPGTELEFAL